jgi:AcrR family transcriptional regulator
MVRVRLDRVSIVHSALVVIDRGTLGSLTLAAVANELGVGSPALYNHLENLEELRYEIAIHTTHALTSGLRDAALGRSGGLAISALAHAYRRFAHEHPSRYASTLLPPKRPDDQLAQASAVLIDVFARVIAAGYDVEAERAVHCARTTRSAIHGFVSLEAVNGFTDAADRDDSFEHLIATVTAGLS